MEGQNEYRREKENKLRAEFENLALEKGFCWKLEMSSNERGYQKAYLLIETDYDDYETDFGPLDEVYQEAIEAISFIENHIEEEEDE